MLETEFRADVNTTGLLLRLMNIPPRKLVHLLSRAVNKLIRVLELGFCTDLAKDDHIY